MATLTVRNLDEALVRQLRVRAAEHGRSAEAEHREILRMVLTGAPAPCRQEVADRLAAFRQQTAGRGGPAARELLAEHGPEDCGPWPAPTPDVAFVVDASVGLKWVLQEPDSPLWRSAWPAVRRICSSRTSG